MPRVSAAHEQEIRARIVVASLRVFAELGYRRATMQDVVRASGLSVGAIYTYFKSKDELFLAGCNLTTDASLGELAGRLAAGGTTAEKLAIGVGYFLDSIDAVGDLPGMGAFVVQAWTEAGTEPAVRETLVRRREQLVTVGQMLLREGMARGEIPAWIDAEAVATAYMAMLDGLILMRVEEGAGYRRADAERRALAILELVLAAAAVVEPPLVKAAPPRPPSLGLGAG
ncbi:MAG: TetR/AcrR family transcriptional regulator [Chloroflexi bacterium]|nr:TetR/AcrR family transcriptional regulator [Chloroflexota bacterium]